MKEQPFNLVRRKIVYYVACSVDGYISGPNEDVSGFVDSSSGVERYSTDLEKFDTVIMGKHTYEFGYKFGLRPGQPAYPHMTHYIFSKTLVLENAAPNVHIKPIVLQEIEAIQNQPGSDIYLCGGGQFAGWLLDHKKIDVLQLKLNPLIQGQGVKIFGNSEQTCKMDLIHTELFDNGLQIMSFNIKYE